MKKYFTPMITTLFLLLTAGMAMAAPGKPSFEASLWADGELFGSKGTTPLPAPNEHNLQSFDKLYVITNSNSPEGQLPVAEAAPGNPGFSGGRWFTHTVEWTMQAFTDFGFVPVLTSDDEVLDYADMGYLIITPGSFPDGPPVYFQCPLLPVK